MAQTKTPTRKPAKGAGSPSKLRTAVEPVGIVEIAERLDVGTDTVQKWRQRGLDFPEPRGTVSGTPWWHWPTVNAWARKTGRD